MKTIAKIFVAISILMISLQATAAGNLTTAATVHYKVQIHLPKVANFDPQNVYVVITDGKGLVAPPQAFRANKLSYDFYEAKAFTGTRIAQLVYSDGHTTGLFNCPPVSISGRFFPGETYEFNLYLVIPKPEESRE
jgi:hypothetical protein